MSTSDPVPTGGVRLYTGVGDDMHEVSDDHPLAVSMPATGGGLTDAQLRAAPVEVEVVGGEGGGLTNAELRAVAVPVSLPVGLATEATLALMATDAGQESLYTRLGDGSTHVVVDSVPTHGVTGTFWQATQPVSGAFYQATQPVSGTFWQATQPVSGPLTDTQVRATPLPVSGTVTVNVGLTDAQLRAVAVPVSGTFYQATQPVSGTFWQATQPVSGTFWQATQPVSGTVTVTPPTLTKGTQGSTGFSVQDLKDSGRVLKTYTCTAIAMVTSEALLTMTPYADLVAGGGATTFAVTSGKRLRIQSITATWRSTSTVNIGAIVRLRLLAGTVLVGSPIHASLGGQVSNLATAVSGNTLSESITFPDGLELSGTMQFGLTQLCQGTGGTMDVQVVGYEY